MGHEPSLRGIVTSVLKRNRTPAGDFQELVEAFKPMNDLADIFGWPKQWLVCMHCGSFSWRSPPHTFDPCPFVIEAAETQNSKMDAERSMAIRAGINFEKQATAFQEMVERMAEDDDD